MKAYKNILVFGATGRTGVIFLERALANGYKVTAFVRNPDKLQIEDRKLKIVQGDIQNQTDVEKATKGQDVVVVMLANKTSNALRQANTVISEATTNIIAAMHKNKVERLFFVSSFGISNRIFWPEKLFIRTFMKNVFADIPKQENLVSRSDLDWTIVRPARLVNQELTEKYKIGGDMHIGLFAKIARADVADFLVKYIQDDSLIDKTVTIIN
jgi:putative NADH-flavin reductase